MKNVFTIFLILILSNSIYAQDKAFCQTYVYEGFIETNNGQKLEINLNFLVLRDSTLVGSYHYKPQDGSLKLVGHINKDNSIKLIERDKNENITGFFKGKVSIDKSKVLGEWLTAQKDKKYKFELTQVKGKSYWDFIKKNRALYEYKDFKRAINEHEKV